MARRILNNAKTIIEYDHKEDITRLEYEDARNIVVLKSDETYIEFETLEGKTSIPIKDVIDLILKDKGLNNIAPKLSESVRK